MSTSCLAYSLTTKTEVVRTVLQNAIDHTVLAQKTVVFMGIYSYVAGQG